MRNDDKVYGFGENICKYLCYNKSNDNKSYVLIKELCDKNIEQFFGYSFRGVFFARDETNTIYSWGWNYYGQLGRGYDSEHLYKYLKPEKNEFFFDKNIIQISCEWGYCLALSSDGKVYGWGQKRFTRCHESDPNVILTQFQ